jgi:hypothetical protein
MHKSKEKKENIRNEESYTRRKQHIDLYGNPHGNWKML